MTVQSRPYQDELERGTYEGWAANQNVLNVLPTGAGKSVCMSKIALNLYKQSAMQCIIAHRNELVAQMSSHVARMGIPHRIVGSDTTQAQIRRQHRTLFNGECFVHPTARTSVVGVDTLIARRETLGKWAHQHDRWMMDEAHHTLTANKWGKAVLMMPNALGAGFTATPVRADGQGLGVKELGGDGLFHRMNLGPSMRWLIDNHFLSDFEILCPKSDMRIEDEGAVSADGDWSHQKLKKAAKKSHIVGDVVENYCKYAYGRQAIVFATDVETGADMAAKFVANGIKAAFLSAETPPAVREKYISEFKSQKQQVLINVDLFDEGFDVPSCDVVMMARPTASLGKYRQMAGRGLRYQVGKVALIIDMVSNVIRHGLPDKEIAWSLARRDKRGKQMRDPEEIPLTTCINCTKPYEKFMVACPYCGSEKPLPEPRSRTLEMVEGDLILLDRETLARMRAATVMENPADISARVAMAAGSIAGMGAFNRQKEKCDAHEALKETIAQWAGIQRARGFDDREIQRKFYYALGMDVVTALDATRPRSEIESIDKTIQAWWRK